MAFHQPNGKTRKTYHPYGNVNIQTTESLIGWTVCLKIARSTTRISKTTNKSSKKQRNEWHNTSATRRQSTKKDHGHRSRLRNRNLRYET